MGYTHYFQLNRELTPVEWAGFMRGAQSIINHAWDIDIDGDSSDEFLTVNGIGEAGHEDFYITRTDLNWNFCKTNRKEYDDVVTALLILIRYLVPQAITVSSDGNWTDWKAGRDIFTEAIHLEPAESSVFGGQEFQYKRGA